MENTMTSTLNGAVAVVTGAGGTLCSEIAKHLAAEGARVALVGRSEGKLAAVAQAITAAGGVCKVAPGDVTNASAMTALAATLRGDWGPCRLLINGAGGNQLRAMTTQTAYEPGESDPANPAHDTGFFGLDADVLSSVLLTNTLGTVIPSQVFGAQMAAAGGGAIINFASMNSYRPLSRVPAYAMSKAAIVNFTQWLAAYLAPANIRVNAIAPGFFINERSVKYLGSPKTGLTPRGDNVMGHTPQKRFGQACDLLGCVDWLLDDDHAGFVTGITVPIDGGFLSTPGI